MSWEWLLVRLLLNLFSLPDVILPNVHCEYVNTQRKMWNRLEDANVLINILIEPPEWLAIEFLLQCESIADVAIVSVFGIANCLIIIFPILFEPGFRNAIGVPSVATFLSFRPLQKTFNQKACLNKDWSSPNICDLCSCERLESMARILLSRRSTKLEMQFLNKKSFLN